MNRDEAWNIGYRAHLHQVDKSGKAYFLHPMKVASMVMDLGEDFEVVALLHDVLEDTDAAVPGLSDEQHAALLAITKLESETHREYILRCRENFIARVVKVADIRHNLSPERMAKLPEKEAKGLEHRYKRSLSLLLRP